MGFEYRERPIETPRADGSISRVVQKDPVLEQETVLVGPPAVKQNNKDTLVVTVNGVPYASDTVSIGYMSAVVACANAQYNKLVASGLSATLAYESVYKTTIGWKGANKELHEVQYESVAEALELAMGEIANIVGA